MEPVIQRAADLLAAGFDRDELRRLLRAGTLVAIRRGVYVSAEPDDADARHLLAVRAALPELADGAVASHASAAALHGLPTWGLRRDRVHVTVARPTGGRRGSQVHVHTAPLEPHEIVTVAGLPTTSRARTVADVARTAAFAPAVAVADAALHAGLDRPALDAALARSRGWPGVPVARRVVAFADGGSESVGESRSRVAIAAAGLPVPALQWPVRYGRATAYTDFAWRAQRTVGEFDGRVKYGRLLRPGQEPGDVVYAEKLREDAIRGQGWEVVRWTWADLDAFGPTAARIRERFRA